MRRIAWLMARSLSMTDVSTSTIVRVIFAVRMEHAKTTNSPPASIRTITTVIATTASRMLVVPVMLTARQLVRGLPVVTRRFAQKLRRVMMVMPMPVDPVMRHVRGTAQALYVGMASSACTVRRDTV